MKLCLLVRQGRGSHRILKGGKGGYIRCNGVGTNINLDRVFTIPCMCTSSLSFSQTVSK